MDKEAHIRSVLKRYRDLRDLEEAVCSDKTCKDLSNGNYERVVVPVEFASCLSDLNSLYDVSDEIRQKQIKEVIDSLEADIDSLCKEFNITLVSAFPGLGKYSFDLTDDQVSEVISILSGGDTTKLYSSKFGYNIYLRDLRTLRDRQWLNDNIINCCVQLAEERAREMGIDVHCFNSFFIKKFTEQGFKAVQRWTRKIDLFSKKRVIVPVNTNNTHWTMAVIDFEKKEIRYCDSMGGSGRYILNNLLQYLVLEYKDKKNGVFPEKEWKLNDMLNSIPQQNNCCDCGVFTCVNSILSCLKRPFDYSQEDIPMVRKYLVYSILQGKLVYCVF